MKCCFAALTLVGLCPMLVSPARGQADAKEFSNYIGEIIIVGNSVTQDRVIRQAVGLYPGQVLHYPDLRRAEQRLRRLGIFDDNHELGTAPTVTALESAGPLKDLLVKVQEIPTGRLEFKGRFTPKGTLVLHLLVEERNFDPWRWPTCPADFAERRAFRGAGKKFRLDWALTPFPQRRTRGFSEPRP